MTRSTSGGSGGLGRSGTPTGALRDRDGASADLVVGQALEPLTLPRIERSTLRTYATVSGDANPLHVDPAAARAVGEDDVIAHGMLSMAYAARFVTEVVPLDGLRSWTLRFVARTPVGSRPTCTAVVRQADGDAVVLDLTVRLEDGTVTARGEANCAPLTERKT